MTPSAPRPALRPLWASPTPGAALRAQPGFSLGAALVATLLLGACAVGPDYTEPELDTPPAWREQTTEDVALGEYNAGDWWNVLDDPELPGIMERAFASNLTLQATLWRLEEAGAALAGVRGQRWPDVDALGGVSRLKPSGNGLNAPPPGVEPFRVTRYQVGAGATMELDVFGRVSRSIEAAAADYEGVVEDSHAVQSVIAAEVTFAYGRARAFQGLLHRGGQRVERQRATLALIEQRNANADLELELSMAQRNLDTTLASIPLLQRGFDESANALAVLLGLAPGEMHAELGGVKPLPMPQQPVRIDTPASILLRRPDVRRAERRLAAETARIGVSVADLYPRFALFGAWTQESLHKGDLLDSDSEGYGYGISVRWHLFDGWRSENRVKVREARAERSLVLYERTVLRAVLQVENALVAYRTEILRRDSLNAAMDAAARAVDLSLERYLAGTVDFMTVIDAEREHFELEQDWARSKGLVLKTLIRLFIALGGGWDDERLFSDTLLAED